MSYNLHIVDIVGKPKFNYNEITFHKMLLASKTLFDLFSQNGGVLNNDGKIIQIIFFKNNINIIKEEIKDLKDLKIKKNILQLLKVVKKLLKENEYQGIAVW